jgi:hypothetical protein
VISESDLEKSLHILQTEAFIEYRPSDIVFRRKTLVDDGAGGKKPSGEGLVDAQRVRVVRMQNLQTRILTDGRTLSVHMNVVGKPDLDVLEGDTFDYNDREFEVIDVQRDPTWRTIAEATRRG